MDHFCCYQLPWRFEEMGGNRKFWHVQTWNVASDGIPWGCSCYCLGPFSRKVILVFSEEGSEYFNSYPNQNLNCLDISFLFAWHIDQLWYSTELITWGIYSDTRYAIIFSSFYILVVFRRNMHNKRGCYCRWILVSWNETPSVVSELIRLLLCGTILLSFHSFL